MGYTLRSFKDNRVFELAVINHHICPDEISRMGIRAALASKDLLNTKLAKQEQALRDGLKACKGVEPDQKSGNSTSPASLQCNTTESRIFEKIPTRLVSQAGPFLLFFAGRRRILKPQRYGGTEEEEKARTLGPNAVLSSKDVSRDNPLEIRFSSSLSVPLFLCGFKDPSPAGERRKRWTS